MKRVAVFVSLVLGTGCTPAPREAVPSTGASRGASDAGTAPQQVIPKPEVAQDAGYTPEEVAFPGSGHVLHGFLWKPKGSGPFPTIVYNHGSEEFPGAKDGQAMFFVPRGFVLFVPHRRGQGRSKDAGRYINDFYDAGATYSPAFVNELVAQNEDVQAAVKYAASLPYVDSKKVALVGCSLGGIESLLGAQLPGIVAAVDFAGASATWATNVPLQDKMKDAARYAKVPVLFIQAENDFDTAPSRVLSDLMKSVGKRSRVHIYPPNGKTAEEGHAFCVGGDNPPWGDEVLSFLNDAMK